MSENDIIAEVSHETRQLLNLGINFFFTIIFFQSEKREGKEVVLVKKFTDGMLGLCSGWFATAARRDSAWWTGSARAQFDSRPTLAPLASENL